MSSRAGTHRNDSISAYNHPTHHPNHRRHSRSSGITHHHTTTTTTTTLPTPAIQPSHPNRGASAPVPPSQPPAGTGGTPPTHEPEESTEQVLLASFKAAALSVTQLYKDSLKHQRAEQAKGYEAALQDFLAFISNHPLVQEKKSQGLSEDEIRQTTSLTIDDIVSFIRNAHSSSRSNFKRKLKRRLKPKLKPKQKLRHTNNCFSNNNNNISRANNNNRSSNNSSNNKNKNSNSSSSNKQAFPPHTASAPLFPSDAFTFSAPIFHAGLDQAALQGIFPAGPEGGIGQQMVDSLKRRYALQDFNLAASRMAAANATRLSNPMNLDVFGFHDGQPPFKRGRRREGE
ncbi:hypothetical protein BG000_010923 [Podila horticola]|nr:hypothetical protein BG000_010923 [Podila horticola]